MSIKQIFDEIANESGSNEKMNILSKYKENELLKRVLYMANSKRVKFYLKQIPEYSTADHYELGPLEHGMDALDKLSSRELTGHAGIEHLKDILSHLEYDDAYIIERIIEKDCKIGMGTSNINKIFPKLIEKTGYMGCKPYSKDLIMKLLAKGPCFSQEKMDGRFINCVIQGGGVTNESRQGEPTILENPVFVDELSTLDDCVLNGELIMEGFERYESNGIIASLITIATKKAEGKDPVKDIAKLEKKHLPYQEALDRIRVVAWDMLTVDEYYSRTCTRPYEDRLNQLRCALKGYNTLLVVETREVTTLEEVMAHFVEILKRNGEGTVVKSKDGLWVDKKPTYQIKVKKEIDLDLKIVGFNYGTGKNVNVISSIDVESSDGLLKTSPTGMSEAIMDHVTVNQEELLNTVLEVKCSGVSQDDKGNYSVLHPVYKKLRDDKDEANSLEECIEIDKSATLL